MKDSDYPRIMVTGKEYQSMTKDRCTRCPVCEKVFCMPSPGMWVYKMENEHELIRYFCSYGCKRKAEQIIHPERFENGKEKKLFAWRDLNN